MLHGLELSFEFKSKFLVLLELDKALDEDDTYWLRRRVDEDC